MNGYLRFETIRRKAFPLRSTPLFAYLSSCKPHDYMLDDCNNFSRSIVDSKGLPKRFGRFIWHRIVSSGKQGLCLTVHHFVLLLPPMEDWVELHRIVSSGQRDEEVMTRRVEVKESSIDSIGKQIFHLACLYFAFHGIVLILLFTAATQENARTCNRWWIPSTLSGITSLVLICAIQYKLILQRKVMKMLHKDINDSRALSKCVQELRMKGLSFDLSKEPHITKKMKSSSVENKFSPLRWCSQFLHEPDIHSLRQYRNQRWDTTYDMRWNTTSRATTLPSSSATAYAAPSGYSHGWTNTGWSHQQPWEFTGNNTGVSNEQDWAARARAWAAAKAAMEAQQAQPQFTPLGRSVEHPVYQDHYSQPVQTQFPEVHQPSLPPLSHQTVQLPPVPVPNMATNQAQDLTTQYPTDLSSSYNQDGFMSYSSNDGAAPHEQNTSVNSSQGSIPTINPSYSQEMVSNYTSFSGPEEHVNPRQTSHSPLSSPMTMVQDDQLSQVSTTQIPSQSTQQPHFTYSDQQVPPAHEVNHQQSEFEHGQEYHQLQRSNYLQPVPTVAMEGQEYSGPPPSVAGWPQLGGPSAPFPAVPPILPSGHQFDHPYMSLPHPIPGPPAHLFGRVPGPQTGPGFRPNLPPIGGPFGIGPGSPGLPPGPAGMVGPAFMGENNGAFGVPERPKKAFVPNWLREELMKNKAVVVANTSAQGLALEDSFPASRSEDANRSFRKADLADSKSVDSGRSSDDEDDEEDELEAARTAAINQEIKRVLTEVLLKVTDDLFDEIAQEVLDEDDHSAQVAVKRHAASDRSRMKVFSKSSPPPPPVQTPVASARVLVAASNATAVNGDDTEKSNSGAPGENLLGLANYASDEDDETDQARHHVSSQGPEQQEGGLMEDGNREELGGQVSAGENSGGEISKDDRQADAERHNPRSLGQTKDTAVNKDAGVTFEEDESLKETLNLHAPKSVEKGIERHQASSKSSRSEIDFDKGRPSDSKDRETKFKENDKHDIRRGASVVNPEHGETKNKKGENKQHDMAQHRKDGERDRDKEKEREREREREREKDREKLKEREKIRAGDKKRDKIHDHEGRKGSDKESRKDHEKDKRKTDKIDDGKKIDKERGEKNGKARQRDIKDAGKYRKRSSSVSSRGRNGKVDSYDSNNSSSGADETENKKRRRVRSSRRSSSPSPVRSRKRQVSRSRSRSRSSHARHSHRRHSPYPSHEGRRKQSRSGSPVRRRRRS